MSYEVEWSCATSVNIMSDYRLDDRATRILSPAEAKEFSSILMSTSTLKLTQPPIQWITGVFSPGVKRGHCVTLTTRPI
jgi:hypothetical protein